MSDLLTYLQIGWRNLWLHPMRTGLTLAGLALGISALTFLSALNEGWVQQLKTNFTLMLMGHVQIHAVDFEQSRSLSNLIETPDVLTDQLDSEPMVSGWTRRIRVSGLASTANGNAAVRVFAVEPELERTLSHMTRFVEQGRWLTEEDDHAVLLGKGLADRLRAGLGNKVVLMAVLPDGDVASEVFRVRGILHSGVLDIDKYSAVIPLGAGQRWLNFEQSVTDIVIYAQDFDSVGPLASVLSDKFSDMDLEILRWSDIDPMAEQLSQFADASAWVFLSIVMFVVMVEVLNTMLMSLHERKRELGMMAALGVTHRQVFAMILWETLILVTMGSIMGFGVGVWISAYFGEHGLDLSRYAEALSFTYMESVIHPQVTLHVLTDIFAAAIIGALVAGFYPAWRATKLEPATAMRQV